MQKGEKDLRLVMLSVLENNYPCDRVLIHHIFCFILRRYRVERDKSQGIDSSKTGSTLKTAEEVKAHLENQLKQARLAAQQVGMQRAAHNFNLSQSQENTACSHLKHPYFL